MSRLLIDRTWARLSTGNKSVRDMTEVEFVDWVIAHMKKKGYKVSFTKIHDLTPECREEILQELVDEGIGPAMLKY